MRFSKKLGFGLMRLPMTDKNTVDYAQTKKMVDNFLANGFTYFDTAHGYIDGMSEVAVSECLSGRYSRDEYILTDKLSDSFFNSEEEIEPFTDLQLEICGVEYFDIYLLHSLCGGNIDHFRKCNAYETCLKMKKEGKIRHLGFSFHDTADVLEQFILEMPEIELVQLQVNFMDWESDHVQSKKCLEVCKKYNKEVIIMEPVKGGRLANLPSYAKQELKQFGRCSDASYAVRFAAGLDNVVMVLSGMSTTNQMNDNISFMKNFTPITDEQREILLDIGRKMRDEKLIQCTGCSYCTAGCPEKIEIPRLFSASNEEKIASADILMQFDRDMAKKCIKCGKCEKICPQHLKIRDYLEEIAR